MGKKTAAATINESELIEACRNGDVDAENELIKLHYQAMKRTHEYGPDGIYGKNRGILGSSFEEALADCEILELFRKCVRTFDPAKSSFRTHLTYRMRMAAAGRVRNWFNRGENEIDLFSAIEKSDEKKYGGTTPKALARLSESVDGHLHAHSAITNSTNEEYKLNCYRLIEEIEQAFGEDSIETRYIELRSQLDIDGKVHTAEICEILGRSRQTLGNIQKRICERFKDRYQELLCA